MVLAQDPDHHEHDLVTDVLDPLELALELEAPLPTERPPAVAALGLASLSASAGLIHAALTPSHMDEWALEGVAFAVAAWIQLGLAAMLLRRRSVRTLQIAVVANVALIAAWVVSRTTGFPFGPHADHAEKISFVDGVAVAAEAALVVGAIAAIVRARPLARHPRLAFVVPAVAVLATTAALLSPSARNHAADAHGVHDGDHRAASGDDKGFSLLHNGQHAHFVSYDLDPASQKQLDAQLAVTRRVARQYPTVAAAEAAGYRRAGPYAPGLGAHWVLMNGVGLNPDGVMDEDDLLHPLSLQFDGTNSTSRLAGFMYYSISPTEPVGFVGRNDVWHYHTKLCIKFVDGQIDAPFGADLQATDAQCAQVGGMMMDQTAWMLHVWSVPGYANREDGVFSENNRKLSCSDGTYYVLPPEEWATHLMNVCRSAA
jgi:hypothetical protein